MIKIVNATAKEVNDVAPLFDAYRVFYKSVSDISSAKKFLTDRLSNNQSTIFIAYQDDKAVGFTQIYPMFSSVSMQSLFILNDLYVDPKFRGKGIGELLLKAGKQYTLDHNGKSLILETAIDNPAQHLYERLGWKKDDEYLHYTWTPHTNTSNS